MHETTHKLLIVDDNEYNLRAMQRLLEDLKIEIHTAESGKEALAAAEHHDYFLIMMDVHMPVMDGFETATIMRNNEKTAGTPIIFVTAAEIKPKVELKEFECGTIDYMLKPVDPVILRSKTTTFLNLYTKQRELESKHSEMQEFLADTANELRAPLCNILMAAQNFAMNLHDQLDVSGVHTAKLMCSEANDLLFIVNDLHDLSRMRVDRLDIELADTSVEKIIDQVVSQFDSMVTRHQLPFTAKIFKDLPTSIRTDSHRIKQILRNILNIAFKFTKKQCSITLKVYTHKGPVNTLEGVISGDTLVFEVKVDGAGIPKKLKESLTNGIHYPHSTKTGIVDINIIFELADLLHGGIQLENEKGKESTFFLHIPMLNAIYSNEPEMERETKPASDSSSNDPFEITDDSHG